MAASMAIAGKPHVYKSCVTEKSLQHGFNPASTAPGNVASRPSLSSSGSMMDVRVECIGERRGEHTRRPLPFRGANPLAMNGTIDMTMSDRGHNVRVKRVMHGQWLSADCGNYARAGE